MSKNIKTVLIVITTVVLLGFLIIIGLRIFVTSIRKQRTCEWANIDNIEMHARVDVPKTISSKCDYNEETNTKMTFF